jgi:hypothetical protein
MAGTEITAKVSMTDKQKTYAAAEAAKTYGTAIIGVGRSNFDLNRHLAYSQHIRDTFIWKVPILPGAATVYQQVAAGREWLVTGKLRSCLRSIDFLHRTEVTDLHSGMRYHGYEEYIRRRALDSLTIGRVAFRYKKQSGKNNRIEYLDPTELTFKRENKTDTPVTDAEKVWTYGGRKFRFDEVHLLHHMPLGSKGAFIAPMHFLVPSATLAWLVREHDSASADGRKIRDIMLVASDQVADAIGDAIKASLGLWAGLDPSKVGVPVVAVNNLSGQPINNMITKIGIAEIPESFDRENSTFNYANEISSALGLALRHFWNEETTTNRALEEIQEQRQLQKGPSAYIRSEERLMNRTKILRQFGRVRFGFVEEVDLASQKNKAEVLKMTAEGLGQFATVLQARLDLDAAVAWMQQLQIMPNDLDILLPGEPGMAVEEEGVVRRNPDEFPPPDGDDEQIVSSDEPPVQSAADKDKSAGVPDYDEVQVDMNGKVVNRRSKVFQVSEYLADLMHQNGVDTVQEVDAEKMFESSVDEVHEQNADELRTLYESNKRAINKWAKDSGTLYSESEIKGAIKAVVQETPITEEQHTIIGIVLENCNES